MNCHHCTGPCEKYGDKCKYGFPRYPLKETLVIDRHEFDDLSEKELKNKASHTAKYRKILSDIEEVLGDDDTIEEIMRKYEKGATEEEYSRNKAKRIDLLLERAGNIDYDDYIMARKTARKYGSTVLLKRDLDEIYVNNYNPEWAEAWNANHDIQPALDSCLLGMCYGYDQIGTFLLYLFLSDQSHLHLLDSSSLVSSPELSLPNKS